MPKVPKLIRVTEVLDYVESRWKIYWYKAVGFDAADKISKESAEFGTKVHEIVEGYLLELHVQGNIEQVQCANAIFKYLEENQVKPLFHEYEKSLEIEVFDQNLGLIGHFDFAAEIDGIPYIVDFKTSNKMRKSFPLQKAAYAKLANKQFGVKIDTGLTIRSHWNKDEKKVEFEVKEYKNLMKNYWPTFKSALKVYQYFNGKGK